MYNYDKLWACMKEKGVSTYVLREKYGMSSATVHSLRHNHNVEVETLDRLCGILECDYGNVIEHIPSKEDTPYQKMLCKKQRKAGGEETCSDKELVDMMEGKKMEEPGR